jgi:hypothetical protein
MTALNAGSAAGRNRSVSRHGCDALNATIASRMWGFEMSPLKTTGVVVATTFNLVMTHVSCPIGSPIALARGRPTPTTVLMARLDGTRPEPGA